MNRPEKKANSYRMRSHSEGAPVLARGEPFVWLMGGALVLAVLMIAFVLGLILYQGAVTFWPQPVEQITLDDGRSFMGEVWTEESYELSPESFGQLDEKTQREIGSERTSDRVQLRTGNYRETNTHFDWVPLHSVAKREEPEWGIILERLEWGRFFGTPERFVIDGQVVAEGPEATWEAFQEHHPDVRDRWYEEQRLRNEDVGAFNAVIEEARLDIRRAELQFGTDSSEHEAAKKSFGEIDREYAAKIDETSLEIGELVRTNSRYVMVVKTAQGESIDIQAHAVVRAYLPNQVGFGDRLGIYFDRWAEFLTDDPREANAEGGVFPAIFGTVMMTLLMCVLVVPFGVLAALYMREYAKAGPVISAVRVAVNNLAGVPSIVFGVFGLGFFCYLIGAEIDQIFYAEYLPNPRFGTGGVFWASLTLALLTLPVVIVTTEEALAAVPSSMREGSYACGASKWQTMRRIVLPRAAPGIMTGAILAMARGAGEVAPIMLVGAVKLAPALPMEWTGILPSIHPERSFMHLGFHIFDLGFQSQDSEGAKPMVYTTTLLLISIIAVLNVAAIFLRARLNRKFQGSQF